MVGRREWVGAAVLVLAACGACSGTGSRPDPGGQSANPAGTVTLAFGGDVHFDGQVAALLDGEDGLSQLRPLLGAADVAVVNLETAITDRGTAQPKLYHFRTRPKALTTLANAGVDVVSLANNHAVDYGPVGLVDTLAAKAASPVPVVGIGHNADEAFAPAVVQAQGLSVAVIASTQVDDFTVRTFPATSTRAGVSGNFADDERLLTAVRSAAERHDVVVVYLHWGTDYANCPDARQFRTAKALEAAGADVVVGGHAHRVQGAGWLGRAYVAYGLGNFVWKNRRGEAEKRSGVLTVGVDAGAATARRGLDPDVRRDRPSVVTSATFAPLRISDVDGIPRPPSDAAALHRAWESARTCARLRAAP